MTMDINKPVFVPSDPDQNPNYGKSADENQRIEASYPGYKPPPYSVTPGNNGNGLSIINGVKLTGNTSTDTAALVKSGASQADMASYLHSGYANSMSTNNLPTAYAAAVTGAFQHIAQNPDAYIKLDNNKVIAKETFGKLDQTQQQVILKTAGIIPKDADTVKIDSKGNVTYRSNSQPQHDGIPDDEWKTYQQNKYLYAKVGKPTPIHYDETTPGEVTAIPYADPPKAVTFREPENGYLMFKNVQGFPVIDKLMNKSTNEVVLQADKTGSFNDDDINAAIQYNHLSKDSAVVMFGADNVARITGTVRQTRLTVIPDSAGGQAGPGQIKFSDLKADPQYGIPKNATFDHFDTKTNQVYFNVVPGSAAAPSSTIKPPAQIQDYVSFHTERAPAIPPTLTKNQMNVYQTMIKGGVGIGGNPTGEQIDAIWNSYPWQSKLAIMVKAQIQKDAERGQLAQAKTSDLNDENQRIIINQANAFTDKVIKNTMIGVGATEQEVRKITDAVADNPIVTKISDSVTSSIKRAGQWATVEHAAIHNWTVKEIDTIAKNKDVAKISDVIEKGASSTSKAIGTGLNTVRNSTVMKDIKAIDVKNVENQRKMQNAIQNTVKKNVLPDIVKAGNVMQHMQPRKPDILLPAQEGASKLLTGNQLREVAIMKKAGVYLPDNPTQQQVVDTWNFRTPMGVKLANPPDMTANIKNVNGSFAQFSLIPTGVASAAEGAEAASGGSLTVPVIIGLLAVLGYEAIKNKDQIAQAVEDFRNRNHRNPTANEVVVNTSAGPVTLASVQRSVKVNNVSPALSENVIKSPKEGFAQENANPPKEGINIENANPPQETFRPNVVKAPQEGMSTAKVKIPSIETFPLGVESPAKGATNFPEKENVKPPQTKAPTTEAGKELLAAAQAKQALDNSVTPRNQRIALENIDQSIKALERTEVTGKTEQDIAYENNDEFRKLAMQLLANKATDAEIETALAKMKAAQALKTVNSGIPATAEGRKIQAEYQAQKYAELMALRTTATESEKFQSLIRELDRAEASANVTPATKEGEKLKAEYKTQRYAELMALRTAAQDLAKFQLAVRSIERANAAIVAQPDTAEGRKIKAEYQAQKVASLNSLRISAAELDKFQAVVRELDRAESSGKAFGKTEQDIAYENNAEFRQMAMELLASHASDAEIEKELAKLRAAQARKIAVDTEPLTTEGQKIKAEYIAKRKTEIANLNTAAKELDKFQTLVRELERAESIAEPTTEAGRRIKAEYQKRFMQEVLNERSKSMLNDATFHSKLNDSMDGGGGFTGTGGPNTLYAVIESGTPTTDAVGQRAAVAGELEKLWKAAPPKRHWSEEDYVAAEDVASDIGMRRLTNPASITGRTIEELDHKIAEAYIKGEITQMQLADYTAARAQMATEDSKMMTGQNSASPEQKTIPKGVQAMALTAGILAAYKAKVNGSSKQQTDTAIKQAIYINTGIQSQPVVKQLTKTAEQVAMQTQTVTNAAAITQMNIKIAENTRIKESEKEKLKEQEQTQTQTAAQTVTAVNTATTTKEVDRERTKEKELEQEQETEKTKVKEPTKSEKKTPFEPKPDDFKNATSFKAGFGWWFRFPQGQWKFYRTLPPGVHPVAPGKGSGYRSAQTVEGQPIVTSKKMGVVDVVINRPAHQPGQAGSIGYKPTGKGRPGLSVTKQGEMLNIKGIGLARKMPHGRILRKEK